VLVGGVERATSFVPLLARLLESSEVAERLATAEPRYPVVFSFPFGLFLCVGSGNNGMLGFALILGND